MLLLFGDSIPSCFALIDLKEKDEFRAVDPHSFFADPDPAVILNADPDPAA